MAHILYKITCIRPSTFVKHLLPINEQLSPRNISCEKKCETTSLVAPTTKRYNVCQDKIRPTSLGGAKFRNESEMAKAKIEIQHLQPSMLPTYYEKEPIQVNLHASDDVIKSGDSANTAKEAKPGRIEASKTYANVRLPLKLPKLSNPFPEPVKVMVSHNTLSDDEKASIMLAEQRMARLTMTRKK